MEIRKLVWDNANREELAGHDITPEEVEAMVALDEWAVDRHPAYADQVRVIGRTPGGRWLTVPMAPTVDPVVWRPATGWASSPSEKAYYWDR